MSTARYPARVRRYHDEDPAGDQGAGAGLPPGTWVKCRGIRRFVPSDPTWKPSESGDTEAESVFVKLWNEPPAIETPPFKPFRHCCSDCGCLLFGIENCPQCEWLELEHRRERENAA